jgi:protein tyrosine/serine phosphatase
LTRSLDFDAIANFRDAGGYATTCGRAVQRGRLYRSGHHHRATDRDVSGLQTLGVAAVLDLREPHERMAEPSRRWPEIESAVIENDIPFDRVSWPIRLDGAPLTYDWVMNDGLDFYRLAPFGARYVDLFRRGLAALADCDGAMVVHCAAGKDRTGLFCALAQHIAGVHPDDIMADFLRSNEAPPLAERMAAARAGIEEAARGPVADDALALCVSVHPAYLEAACAAMAAAHGSLDGYLEQVLGVDGLLRDRLHGRLLA